MCHKRHPKPCKSYAQQTNCSFGDKCKCSHEEKENLPEEVKLKDRIAELEKVIKEKSLDESKIEHAVRELEKVVKAMSCKVIHLEDEITNIKVNNRIAKVDEPFKDTSE